MSLLIANGLMPKEEAARKALEVLDPYKLRIKALNDILPACHVGRALFHLNQRRGFLCNRKTERDAESGAIKLAAGKLQDAIWCSGARTLGEFFYGRHCVRAALRVRNMGISAKAEYDSYPMRQHLLDEFDAIWASQAPHHAAMTEDARTAIHSTIFY